MEFLDTCRKCLQYIPIAPVEPSGYVEDVEYDDVDFIEDIDFIIEDNDLRSE